MLVSKCTSAPDIFYILLYFPLSFFVSPSSVLFVVIFFKFCLYSSLLHLIFSEYVSFKNKALKFFLQPNFLYSS
jgi:hypothetical protein